MMSAFAVVLAIAAAFATPVKKVDTYVAKSRAVANQVWGAPCGGQYAIKFRKPPRSSWGGWVNGLGDCRGGVHLARWVRRQPYPVVCTIILHEVGHLAGRDHTRRGIMAAHWRGPDRRCREWR